MERIGTLAGLSAPFVAARPRLELAGMPALRALAAAPCAEASDDVVWALVARWLWDQGLVDLRTLVAGTVADVTRRYPPR